MASDNDADTLYIDPSDETAVTRVLSRDAPIWAQIPDESPTVSPATARRNADDMLTEIYREHRRSLLQLAMLFLRDVPTAEDVVQEAFAALHSRWQRLRDPEMALPYLRQAVVNRARSTLQRPGRTAPKIPEFAMEEPSAEQSALWLLERSAVVAALRALPERQREVITLRYYADLSEADIAATMGISRNTVKYHRSRGIAALKAALERGGEIGGSDYATPATIALPVSIYLADEVIHGQVEAAVEAWLALAEITIEDSEPPIIASWFRRMKATAKVALESEATRDLTLTTVHAADARIVLAQDATITATLMSNLAPVIASLQPTKDAVLRVGALLIVKVDWTVQVVQLTAAQQAILDHRPQLTSAPHEIVAALQLSQSTAEHTTSTVNLNRPYP